MGKGVEKFKEKGARFFTHHKGKHQPDIFSWVVKLRFALDDMVPYIIDRVAILLEEERVVEMYEHARNTLVVGTKRNKDLI